MLFEGFYGNSCNDATKNLEEALGQVTVKNKSSEAFIQKQNKNSQNLTNKSNVSF